MSDHEYRMYKEALSRLHDADILAQSGRAQSDSQQLLSILGFEVLLKCALRLCGTLPARTHQYHALWRQLPSAAQDEILATARDRMPEITHLSAVEPLLIAYQFIFEKGRYYYELYEDYTLEQEHELGEFWLELGAPEHEADLRYWPLELECLIHGLRQFIEIRLGTAQDQGSWNHDKATHR